MHMNSIRRNIVSTFGSGLIIAAIAIRAIGVIGISVSSEETADALCVQPDTRSYSELGSDLADGAHDTASKRMPLYPLLLHSTGALADDGNGLTILLVQQLLDLMTALIIGAIASRFSRRAFLPAIGISLLVPALVIHSFMLLPESLMVTICAATGYLWIRLYQSESFRWRAATVATIGILLSIGVAVKPVMALAWLPYTMLILLYRRFPLRQKLVLIPLLILFSGAFGWTWRHHNSQQFGLDALSTQTSRDPFERVLILSGEVGWDRASRDSIVNIISSPALSDSGYNWAKRDSIFKSIMWTLIREDPLRIAVPHLTSWPGFFKPGTKYFEDLPLFQSSPLVFYLISGLAAAMALSLACLFIISLLRRKLRSRASPLIGLAAAWFIFSAAVSGPAARAPRYGLTFFWAFAATGGVTVAWLLDSRQEKNSSGEGGTSH